MGFKGDFRSGARGGEIFGAALVGAIVAGAEVTKRAFTNPPWSSPAKRELKETIRLYENVKAAFNASPYADLETLDEFMFNIVEEAASRAEVCLSIPLGEALFETTRELLITDGSLYGWINDDSAKRLYTGELNLEEGVQVRNFLRAKQRFLANREYLEEEWREKITWTYAGMLGYLPASVFAEDEDDRSGGDAETATSVPFIDLCELPAEVIERLLSTILDDDVIEARLFEPLRQQLEENLLAASGIPTDKRHEAPTRLVLPTAARGKSNADLVEAYTAGTPFADVFTTRLPFSIPFPARFEHTHIVGGTGHGKTQLMQLMIRNDLERAQEDGRSLIVIDSQGDLIRTVSHLSCFSPDAEESLADRLVLIDPNDVEYPACLNMFDFNRDRLASYGAADRERILNGTIELYEYFFGALLGAELTQRQGLIFRYLARLMLEIPNATVHTLRMLMEDGEPFRPYIERLPPTARSFFTTQFFDRSFNQTRKQVLTRLWGVLSSTTIERLFSHPENKLDLFDATNAGKIILINTAKDLLKQEGSAIFGRFFVALIAQAAIQRAVLAVHDRRPTFVYIDECADYFDDNIDHLLNQARKYRVGMILAHQNLDQLSTGLRASFMSSTSIKFAGGVSNKDARSLAQEMRCDPDFVQDMRKRRSHTEFACWIKNLTTSAIEVAVPLGYVDELPTLDDDEFDALVEANRARYCAPVAEVMPDEATQPPLPLPAADRPPAPQPPPMLPSVPEERTEPQPRATTPAERRTRLLPPEPADHPAPPPPPPSLGRGGRQHKYLQAFVKQVAEERGYRASIEHPVLNGAGSVDVALTRGEDTIACEISVTSSRDQELANVEKCLAAGYKQVILIAPHDRHVRRLSTFITPQLEEEDADRVLFLTPEIFSEYLTELDAGDLPPEETVRGYRVRVSHQAISDEEAQVRRQAIASVIARSLGKLDDNT